MSKTIWVFNDYAGSKYHGMEFRNYYLAKEWVKEGHKVYIITASHSHLFKNPPAVKKSYSFENIDGINYIWVKVPRYSSSMDRRRVVKWLWFTMKLCFLPIKKMGDPDVIIASPMAPFMVYPAFYYSKKYGAKFVYEVKDIWPLSLIQIGGYSKYNPIVFLMSIAEKFAVNHADLLVSNLQNYDLHLKENLKADKSFVWIGNGIDLEEDKNKEPLSEGIKRLIPQDKFIVGYVGAIGLSNAINYLCEAAKNLGSYDDIVFVIVGDGKEKVQLQKRYDLKNLIFLDPVKKSQVQSLLSFFNVCYIGLRKKPIFKYGVSPNKIFDYMLSGKPILYAIDSGESNVVRLANCGLSVEPENAEAIKGGVLKLYYMNEIQRKKIGDNGRRYVIENFTYKKLSKDFLERLYE